MTLTTWPAGVRGKRREGKGIALQRGTWKAQRTETLKLPETSCQKWTLKKLQGQKECKPAGRIPIRLKRVLFTRKTAAQIISFLTSHGRGCQKLVSILLMPQLTKQQTISTALQSSINIIMYNTAWGFPDLDVSPLILPCLEGPESLPHTTCDLIPGGFLTLRWGFVFRAHVSWMTLNHLRLMKIGKLKELGHQQQGSNSINFHGNEELLRHMHSNTSCLASALGKPFPPPAASPQHILINSLPHSGTVFTSGWPGSLYINPRVKLWTQVDELRVEYPEEIQSQTWVPWHLQVSMTQGATPKEPKLHIHMKLELSQCSKEMSPNFFQKYDVLKLQKHTPSSLPANLHALENYYPTSLR